MSSRSPRRDEARRMYLSQKGDIELKAIAEKLGIPASRVRKWKSEDKWDADLNKPKKGPPFGSKNALGNRGGPGGRRNPPGGAPKRSQNALKTGEYATIWLDSLTEEEREIYERVNLDPLIQLDESIVLLTIRERRMLQNIARLKEQKELAETSMMIVKNKKGEVVHQEATKYTKLLIDKLVLAEDALTRVQEKKIRAIDMKHKMLMELSKELDVKDIKVTIKRKEEGADDGD